MNIHCELKKPLNTRKNNMVAKYRTYDVGQTKY